MKPTLAEQKETEYENPQPKCKLGMKHLIPWAVNAVLKIDHKAFLVTSDVKNVNGVGYTLSRAEHAPKIPGQTE